MMHEVFVNNIISEIISACNKNNISNQNSKKTKNIDTTTKIFLRIKQDLPKVWE